MPLIGYDNFKKLFEKLIKEERLSHSYIFFGEPQVGKYTFAYSLASMLEREKFDIPDRILSETLIVNPKDGSIGIDEVRGIKYFLAQKPVQSKHRVVIIDDAQLLTTEAQNAALKIAEEPLGDSLFILIVQNIDAIMPTLQSRFQKIHFPRLKKEEIIKLLEKVAGLAKAETEKIAKLSLGRPGRAIDLALNDIAIEYYKSALALLMGKKEKRQIIEELMEDNESIQPLLTELIAELARDPVKNYDSLRLLTERMTIMSKYSVNKRLQLETALWNI